MSDKPASRRDLYALIMRAYAEAGIKPGAGSPFSGEFAYGARWVMDLGWYRAVRAAAGMPETPGEPQVPSPADMLFGMPVDVRVCADSGEPRIVTPLMQPVFLSERMPG